MVVCVYGIKCICILKLRKDSMGLQKNCVTQSADKRTEKRRVGDAGENLACRYLENKGYRIIERNFSCRSGEIDIIAALPSKNILCFIEVKSRNTIRYGLPSEAVTLSKQRKIKRSAAYYIRLHRRFSLVQGRFDIVEVLRLDKGTYIRHMENAFE